MNRNQVTTEFNSRSCKAFGFVLIALCFNVAASQPSNGSPFEANEVKFDSQSIEYNKSNVTSLVPINANESYLYQNALSPLQNATLPILTYSISRTNANEERSSFSLLGYTFSNTNEQVGDVSDNASFIEAIWQTQVGFFLNMPQSASYISHSHPENPPIPWREVSLGFRWGASNLSKQTAIESYSVLLGYAVAETVELNVGFSALEFNQVNDSRSRQDRGFYEGAFDRGAFYEGTWYAGFSAKF